MVLPETEYPLLGVRLDGAGPFHRETKTGQELSSGTLSQVRAGDFIYSRIFAWRGAFGVVPARFDGYFVSNELPVFEAIGDAINPYFLAYWFRLPETLSTAEADCTGSTPTRE